MESVVKKGLVDQAMDRCQKNLLPFILLMYILAFLDRANIGFAKTAFQLDTGVSDAAYALGAGIFFIGYAICEVPSNIIMHHVGARVWMARIMITWGIVAAGFAFVKTDTQFLVLRVLLGICEAGFFPGIIYYLTLWFTAERRGTVMGFFYFGPAIAFIFGSPLSGLLMDMDGFLGFKGWEWMFAVEGLMATVVGIWALWYLVDRPEKAKWLPEDEKQALVAALQEENDNKPKEKVSALKVLADFKVLYLCAIYFCIQLSVYGVTFYLPTQVAGLIGKKVGLMVGLVSAIPWICTLIGNSIIPQYSDRSGKRGILAAGLMFAAGVGICVSGTTSPVVGILGLCVASMGYFAAQPIFWIMPTRFLNGVAAASAIGFINAIGNLGGFVAPNLRVWAEQTFHSPVAGLYAIGTVTFIGAVLFLISIPMGMGKNTEAISKVSATNNLSA
ncbi:MAG: rhmT [Firmicutes bacterium]|nr:rhmT [Bacillota bacterium]